MAGATDRFHHIARQLVEGRSRAEPVRQVAESQQSDASLARNPWRLEPDVANDGFAAAGRRHIVVTREEAQQCEARMCVSVS